MAAIEVSDLTKTYGTVRGVDSLSFAVEDGEVFGFLGPNGAGKTTTIRTLMGFQAPTAGAATVLGAAVTDEAALVEAKRRIGYLPANPAFDETATGREILALHGAIKGDERREELLALFDPPLDRAVREYSTGNRQKLGVVQAFMHDPELVVMDEPTSGLDPLLQRRFEEFVRAEAERGVTVFFSSHVLGEVRRVCDRVGILREGELVATERIDDLLDRSGKTVRARGAETVDRAAFEFPGVHDLAVHESDGDAAVDVAFTYTGEVGVLLDRLAPLDLVDLTVEEAPLEEVFLRFYGDADDGSRDSDDTGGTDGSNGPDGATDRAATVGTGSVAAGNGGDA